MKKFNREKALRKIEFKRKWQQYSRYVYLAIPCVLCGILGLYLAYSKFFVIQEEDAVQTKVGDFVYGDVIINNYVNGKYTVEAPAQATGYEVEKITCDNGAVGQWNIRNWVPEISNITQRSKCNIYFGDAKKIKIGAAYYQVNPYGKCPVVNDDNTSNVTELENTYGYICSMKDAYGTSYYYRGNVTNNYVKFGSWASEIVYGYYNENSSSYKEYASMDECQNASSYNKNCTVIREKNTPIYWRIIRINGDGTVRVIYDGTSPHENSDGSTDRQIGTTTFNRNHNDNAYVGYMYGTAGASTYAETHANINNSTIKTYLDTWYETNIKGTNDEQYIADNLFCNDRSLASDNTGTGAGKSSTSYRMGSFSWDEYKYTNKGNRIMFTCPQKNDAFTVNDTTNGNGSLTYGIGLITKDELILAGNFYDENNSNYLYSGNNYWTMTAFYSSSYSTKVHVAFATGRANYNSNVEYYLSTRPVLNLKSDVLQHGTGTATDPYRIVQ